MPDFSWTVYHRYSAFVALHDAISPPAPPAPLPGKNYGGYMVRKLSALGGWFPVTESQRKAEEEEAGERCESLQLYLRAILSARDAQWRSHSAFLTFLQISEHVPASMQGKADYTAAAQRRISNAQRSVARPQDHAQQRTATETDATRTLDDRQLLKYQTDTLMDSQDRQAERLAQILQRQRALGLSINDELHEQSELLQGLHAAVQTTEAKMGQASERMKEFERK
ncbi:hypothetical protein MVES_000278 [Malassezia vespertilionis]|uniref:Uncharacterized protein n=2 Tax=Malassezia vespertilionis TaxID=2020962 RepID=A0A2N1JGH8_9BASI|nr:hypothetical protein MVES_000278 [Malassezia vespertilionis]